MDPFRTSFEVLLAALILLQTYYAVKGRGRAEEHVPEKAVTAVRLTVGIVFAVTIGVYVFNPQRLAVTAVPMGPAWRWTGAVIFAISLGLLVWVNLALGEHYSSELRIRSEHQVVDWGPYRYVRHPMYSAVFLMIIGMGLLSANWLIAASGLVVIGTVMWLRAPQEEAMMTRAFGERYCQYAATTGRFLPRLSR
jgi:protein-S-isoprenylcysteine O-methyltransferase Ste14